VRVLLMFLVGLTMVFAAPEPAQSQFFGAKKEHVFQKNGLAIDGYDTVAYFDLAVDGKAVKGDPQFSYSYNGATWLFSSAGNLQLFMADPAKYAPAYNGYCAYAVARNRIAKTEPDAWTIVDGRLYLNYDLNIRSRWLKDVPGYLTKSEKNWPTVSQKLKPAS